MTKEVTTILDRIKSLIKEQGLSDRAFSMSIGIPPMTLSSMFKRNSDPSALFIATIITVYPKVSAEWLLRGEGEMYKTVSENNNIDESQYVSIKKYERIVNLFGQTASELKEMALENKRLYEEIRNLKGQLKLAKYA